MDRLGDLGGPAVQDGPIVFVRLACVHWATCLGTPGRLSTRPVLSLSKESYCRRAVVVMAEDDPSPASAVPGGRATVIDTEPSVGHLSWW
jgi:hypothetical protein